MQLDENFQSPLFSRLEPNVRALLLPDGKFLLFTGSDSVTGQRTGPITRHLPNGDLDPAFSFTREYKYASAGLLAPDGKLYFAVTKFLYHRPTEYIVRAHPDGALDSSYPPVVVTVGTGQGVRGLLLQPDGKLLVSGYFASFGTTSRAHLVRLLPDGRIDESFSSPQLTAQGSRLPVIWTVTLTPAGKLMVVGHFVTVNGTSVLSIARLEVNGALDPGFQGSGFDPATHVIRRVLVQPDGRLMLAGGFRTVVNSRVYHRPAVCLFENGEIDTTFDIDLFLVNSVGRDAMITPDSKVVVVTSDGFSGPIRRFDANGQIDASFARVTFQQNAFTPSSNRALPSYIALQPDGKFLVSGYLTRAESPSSPADPYAHFGVVRLTTSGTVDPTLQTHFKTGQEQAASGFHRLPDGRTLVQFQMWSLKSDPPLRNNLARLLPDGTIDGGFNPGPVAPTGFLGALYDTFGMEPLADGRMFLWGHDGAATGYQFDYGKMLPDGTRDRTSTRLSDSTEFESAHALPNGKVLVAAESNVNAMTAAPLWQVQSNGLPDPAFTLDPAILAAQVHRESLIVREMAAGHRVLATQSDGKILVEYLTLEGLVRLERLLPSGSRDSSFAPTVLPPRNLERSSVYIFDHTYGGSAYQPANGVLLAELPVTGAIVQPDSRIVLVGHFTSFNGVAARGVVRLQTDGSVDTSFTDGGGAQWTETQETVEFFPGVEAIAQQNDGKLLLAGTFEAFNGTPAPGIVSLNSDGSIDSTFKAPLERERFSRMVAKLRRQADGSLLLAGPYSDPAGEERSLWRIENVGGVPIIGSHTIAKALPEQPFTYQIVASGQPHTYGASGLPAGFQLNAQTGLISGTPTPAQIGVYQVGLTATNAEGTSAIQVLQLTVPAPVQVESVVSQKWHGSTRLDLPLALSGTPTVESRRTNPFDDTHSIVFRFTNQLVSVGELVLSSGSGSVTGAEILFDRQEYGVDVTAVANGGTLKLTLYDVIDAAGNHSPEIELQVAFLLGDVNGNGIVNTSDIGLAKSLSGQAATPANLRADVNLSGGINSSDIAIVKANAGSSVQEPVNNARAAK